MQYILKLMGCRWFGSSAGEGIRDYLGWGLARGTVQRVFWFRAHTHCPCGTSCGGVSLSRKASKSCSLTSQARANGLNPLKNNSWLCPL